MLIWESVAHGFARIVSGVVQLLCGGLRTTDAGAMHYPTSQLLQRLSCVERVTGIEPALSAWESDMEPCAVLRPKLRV
jgi:hypothetical protein